MTGEQLREFIVDYLGPTCEKHGLDTEIWLGKRLHKKRAKKSLELPKTPPKIKFEGVFGVYALKMPSNLKNGNSLYLAKLDIVQVQRIRAVT
ncbi:hypothetical protein V7139_08295 [Neobacillus drentensis]